MRCTRRVLCASLFTVGALLAQNHPHPGFGGPGGGPAFNGPGFDGPGFGERGPGGSPVTGAPYSATKLDTHQETLADGNTITQTRTEKIYRDSEGRTRTESTMTTPSGMSHTRITIFDPVAGFVAHLNPADSTAVKMTLPTPPSGSRPARPTLPADANTPQVVTTDLTPTTIEGLAVTGKSITRTIPAGAVGNSQPLVETREIWLSTALKVPVKVTSTDPRHGTSTMVLSNVSQSAPDASLFQIPSSYTVKDAPAHRGPGGPPPSLNGSSL